ncbi:trypsin-like peptidase domain-containing protein [Paraburkholderia azotifigens]|uniref:trypsin-like peptidase domain-containing protein n=1 Tax=Paraburkholderia azotifigens TaxID=2057004 RepID=UPI00317C2E9D
MVCLTGFPGADAIAASPSPAASPTAASASAADAAPAKYSRVAPDRTSAPIGFPVIVERYGPAVVNIRSTRLQKAPARGSVPEAVDNEDPIFAFFKQSVPQTQDGQSSEPRAIAGSGSGVIVSANGLILTTADVVDQSDDVTVRLTDRREFNGKVVAVDAQSDLAAIRIDATKLPTVKLGDSTRVRVGEQVLTIGSPDSYQNTVTVGFVSATSRTLADGTTFPFFQTDVSLNPDNSGGPVFNRAGEVVGISVQVYGDADRFESLTFAIPINLANKMRSQLQDQHGPVENALGNLGIQVQDVDQNLASAFGLPRAAGALVISVDPGSPAAASRVKPGDVVVQLAGYPIGDAADVVEQDAALHSGTRIPLKLIRDRKQVTLMVNLGTSTRDDDASAQTGTAMRPVASKGGALDHLGLTMHPLTDDERRSTGLADGLMVDEVSGTAGNAGIKPGDVLLSLNGTLVASQDQLASVAAGAGKNAAILIQRDHARSFVTVDLK